MVIILKQNAKQEEISELLQWIRAQNVDPQSIEGESQHILGLVGNTHAIDIDAITTFPAVENVRRIAEPYKKATANFIITTQSLTLTVTKSVVAIFRLLQVHVL